jgi:hypothetical protein
VMGAATQAKANGAKNRLARQTKTRGGTPSRLGLGGDFEINFPQGGCDIQPCPLPLHAEA